MLRCLLLMTIYPWSARSTIIIGDSLFWSGSVWGGGRPSPLSQHLETWAGHPIENHARVGAALEDGWIKSIPSQFHDLPSDKTIPTLIMDGGGNDLMIHRQDCRTLSSECTAQIDRCGGIVESILQDSKHITNLVYLGFYYLPEFSPDVIDYANEAFQARCSNQSIVSCWFVDPRSSMQAWHVGNDGVHPTEEGYRILAQQVWDTATSHSIVL